MAGALAGARLLFNSVPETYPQHSLSKVVGEQYTILALAGEIDISNADEIAEEVRNALAAGPVSVDLSKLSFIDSSGLRMLVELVRDAQESDWSLKIGRDLPPGVRRLLEITGMLEMLPLDGTGAASESR
jgi:anti-anti-sigma factor